MFKRVEKRRRKKQEEEELGLDEDMKEVLGIHDTDSEESASDSDGSDEGSDEEVDEVVEEDVDEEGDEDEDEEAEGGDEDEDEDPNITVSQALVDSIYVVSVLPEVKACIVCPGKLLKGAKMVQLHRISNAHERRLKQFKTLSVDSDPKESAWEILRRNAEEKPKLSLAPSTTSASKRAEKKKAQQARRKVKREKFKARQAKKAIAASTSATEIIPEDGNETLAKPKKVKKATIGDSSEATTTSPDSPPKKKRKVDSSTKTNSNQNRPPSTKAASVSGDATPKPKRPKHRIPNFDPSAPPVIVANSTKSQESVKAIVRSTSDRAKDARSRAMSMSRRGGSGRGSSRGGGRGRGNSRGGRGVRGRS